MSSNASSLKGITSRDILGTEPSDSFAKHARYHVLPLDERVLPRWPAQLAAHPLARWAWLCAAPSADLPTLFAFEPTAGYLQTQSPGRRPSPTAGLVPPAPPAAAVHLDIRFATYNVLTLLDVDGPTGPTGPSARPVGLRLVGKRRLLTQQCEDQGVHMLGLQETRLQETAILPDSSYILLHAAADEKGQYGCALWLSKRLPYARCGTTSYYFDTAHCTVAAFSPRHLLVCIDAPSLLCAVLVAHVPSDPTGTQRLAVDFWTARAAEISRLPRGHDLILLTDANGWLGSHISPAVSDHGSEAENPGGLAFHDFLVAHHLCVPATFAAIHSGESWTWCSPTGFTHRLDYVAVPQAWLDFELHSHVWYGLEALQKRYDHVPVVLRSRFQTRHGHGAGPTFKRRACRPNDLDPSLDRKAFCQALTSAPTPLWTVDVDTHFSCIAQSWLYAGQVAHVQAVACPRQSYLTADTMQWVDARKALQQYLP